MNANETKAAFVDSIYNWLMETLETRGNSEYKGHFRKEGSSILCDIPQEYFKNKECTPITVEMKFIKKKV